MVAGKQVILFEPKLQLLANYLLAGSALEVLPTPDREIGARYLEAERITDDPPATVKIWLEGLASSGVLQRRFVNKIVLCPKCGSANTPVQYCCPVCRSIDIDKKTLLEHLACGAKDKDDSFRRGSQWICPRCSRPLGELGINHKTVGTWFLCRACQKPFDRPQSFHVCEKCRHFFVIEEAVLTDVYAYRLSEDTESQLKGGGVFVKPLKEVLESLGYRVETAGILRGVSGTDHRFDLVGVRESGSKRETVAVDLVASDRLVGDESITTMFAKRYDTNPEKSALVVIPGIVENGRKLASLYKIALIEAASATEAVEKLRLSLSP